MQCSTCSAKVTPILAVDLDGTLGDYHNHFTHFAASWLGQHLPLSYDGSIPFHRYLGLDIDLYRQIKLAYRQGGMKRTMKPLEGAGELVRGASNLGAEIWVTTTRPYMRLDNVDPDTREWLRRYDLPFDHMLYDDDKYEQMAAQVDSERVVAIVDDLPEQIEAAARWFGREVPLQPQHRWNSGAMSFAPGGTLVQVAATVASRITEWYEDHG